MKEIKINMNNCVLFFVLILSILPILNIAGYEVPTLYLLLPVGSVIFIFILLGWYKVPRFTKLVILLFFLIITEIFLSTLYGTVTKIGNFEFPTDGLQYTARFLVMITFIVVFYYGKINEKAFIKYFLIVLNMGMLIGLLQWIPWFGREFLVKLYPFHNITHQLNQLNNTLSGVRVHGIAQHATANGGLAAFFFIFGYSIFRYYKKYYLLSISLMLLSIVNIFASQARAGILMLFFSFFLFYLINIYVQRKSFKPTLYLLIAITHIYFFIIYLYKTGNKVINKMIYRWEYLIFKERGGARVDQLDYFLSLLKNPFDYLFGLSKQVVNQSAIPFGVEIEPANILVTYGVIGFILQYGLIIVLLLYFLSGTRKMIMSKATLALFVASFVGLASYQVFSIGFYFFREIRVGIFPWILMGVTIGVYERYIKVETLNSGEIKFSKK